MDIKSAFQKQFFEYQQIIPIKTIYLKEFAKSNDLRLLIQIFTRSYLRMFTDSKTNNLHFICKQKGPDCFDLEAIMTLDGHGFYFSDDIKKYKHRNKCEQDGTLFKYLQIYNLMKLKKQMIQDFMRNKDLMKQPPSVILSKLSQDSEAYFFEPYINGQGQLKRKLRKRFDNVVNIDIKKIGRVQERDQQEIIQTATKKGLEKTLTKKNKAKKELQKPIQQDQEQKIIKIYPKQKKIAKIQTRNSNKKIAEKNQVNKTQIQQVPTDQFNQMKEYIFILGEGIQLHKEEVVQIKPSTSLPALDVLNEQAFYNNWDSSSGQDQSVKEKFQIQVIEINKQDYFKSLRNSTLKKSLQRQSLTPFMFMKQNKENFLNQK